MLNQDQAVALAQQAWHESGEGWVSPAWFADRAIALERLVTLAYAKGLEDAAKEAEFYIKHSTVAKSIAEDIQKLKV